MDEVKVRMALMKRFDYAAKKRNGAYSEGEDENMAYWQGQKDAARLLMVELELVSSQRWIAVATANEETFSNHPKVTHRQKGRKPMFPKRKWHGDNAKLANAPFENLFEERPIMGKLKPPKNYREVALPDCCWNCKHKLNTWMSRHGKLLYGCGENVFGKGTHKYEREMREHICDSHKRKTNG